MKITITEEVVKETQVTIPEGSESLDLCYEIWAANGNCVNDHCEHCLFNRAYRGKRWNAIRQTFLDS